MPATVLRWFHSEADPPIVQRLIVEPEEQLALRNQQRLEQAKRILGGRYVLHSSNQVLRQNVNQPRKLAARALASNKLRNSEPDASRERPSFKADSERR
jgi:hypothetical protein